jgi:hypothetical protein
MFDNAEALFDHCDDWNKLGPQPWIALQAVCISLRRMDDARPDCKSRTECHPASQGPDDRRHGYVVLIGMSVRYRVRVTSVTLDQAMVEQSGALVLCGGASK